MSHRNLQFRPGQDILKRCRHLRLVLDEYVEHFNSHRPHRTLRQRPPGEREHPPAMSPAARVLRRDRLGGLIHEYAQVA